MAGISEIIYEKHIEKPYFQLVVNQALKIENIADICFILWQKIKSVHLIQFYWIILL